MPTPRDGENRDDFVSRCMADEEARADFPDTDQRAAFCNSQWERRSMNELQTITANAIGPVRSDTLMGRDFRVFPAVLVKSKVLKNNLGSTFLPADEIKASVDAWNATPVLIRHPTQRGQPISARNPKVLNSKGVGFVFEAAYDEERQALTGEVWIERERAANVKDGAAVLKRVEQGQPGELSTGFGLTLDQSGGAHNGERYDVTLRNLRPDHLALLVEETGACSVTDGCGLGINHDGPCTAQADAEEGWQAQLMGVLSKVADVLSRPVFNASKGAEMREQWIAQLAEAGPLDRDTLATLSDCQLKALVGVNEDDGEGGGGDVGDPESNAEGDDATAAEGGDPADGEEGDDDVREALQALQSQVAALTQDREEEREELIGVLVASDRVPFERAELESKDLGELQKLHRMARGHNFTGRNGSGGNAENDSDPDYAPVRPYWETADGEG